MRSNRPDFQTLTLAEQDEVRRYLRGPRSCARYDQLSDWAKAFIGNDENAAARIVRAHDAAPRGRWR